MTELIVISDIHSNYPAVQQVVEQEGLDAEYAILGDIMGLNAYPNKTLELVQEVGDHIIAGANRKI